MSGGFFRGTSSDQDTRFSNKQAKLLKSQKFASELENLVDMSKVKMDVMRPWIAKRVTELIGFEDEVLINFIYGLLEGKQVNGKQIQISLTGFMERNTGKFMKELWVLLLSAQQNASGVPQQFLDEKEEETRKKKVESDRIANEIQKKKEKEKQDAEQEKTKMDGDGAISREKHAELSSIQPADETEKYRRNGQSRRRRGSQSPDSFYHSPSPSRRKRSISPMKSSHSRSHSDERRRSRSRSIPSDRRRRSSPKRSVTPRRRHRTTRRSPSPWRRSSYSKRRSISPSRRRSPSSPRYRVRSPLHRRSHLQPLRSRTPIRKSPVRYNRSKTPIRRSSQSPVRHRSSPMQGRSPSPSRRKSPSFVRRRSPSPSRRRYRRSPSTPRQQSISPDRRRSMHGQKRSFTPVRRTSSPQESSSPSHIRRSSFSPVRKGSPKRARSPIQSPGERARRRENYSPARRGSQNERAESPVEDRRGTRSGERRPAVILRSPQRDILGKNDSRGKELDSPSIQKSPFASRGRSYSEKQRSTSPEQRRENMNRSESPSPARKPRRDSSGTSADDDIKFSSRSSRKVSPTPVRRKDLHNSADGNKSRKSELPNSDRQRGMVDHKEHREKLSTTSKTTGLRAHGRKSYNNAEAARVKDKKIARPDELEEALPKLRNSEQQNVQNDSLDSPSKEMDEHRVKSKEKRKKHKMDKDRQEVESDDYSSYDSYERKEAKRRKEEKKSKKEERRRRREERHCRRDGRRTEKLKAGSSSSDLERDHSENGNIRKDTDSDQKRLEIELREKALESLRAKKGFGN